MKTKSHKLQRLFWDKPSTSIKVKMSPHVIPITVLSVTLGHIVENPRGNLERVRPRENLKPRDVPKANPRVQPKGLPSEYPEAFRFSLGGTYQILPKAFPQSQTLVS